MDALQAAGTRVGLAGDGGLRVALSARLLAGTHCSSAGELPVVGLPVGALDHLLGGESWLVGRVAGGNDHARAGALLLILVVRAVRHAVADLRAQDALLLLSVTENTSASRARLAVASLKGEISLVAGS
jgi:hypothetical protein